MTKSSKKRLRQGLRTALLVLTAGIVAPRPPVSMGHGLATNKPMPAAAEGALSATVAERAFSSGAIILDPGHGGKDFGATVGRQYEKDISLAVAKKLQGFLEQQDKLQVLMTRDSDFYVPLDQRVEKTTNWRGRVLVSLHVNRVRNKNLRGIEVFSYGRSRYPLQHYHHLPPLPAPPKAEIQESAVLAHFLVQSLRSEGFRLTYPDHADYYVLKNPTLPSVLIELGYMSNSKERANLTDPSYQEKLAASLARGLESYLAKNQPNPSPASLSAAK